MMEKTLTLDKWLQHLNLWRGPITTQDLAKPYILTGSDFDENGLRLNTVRSETRFDPDSGLLEDHIEYWRHLPFSGDADQRRDASQHHVLTIKGRCIVKDQDSQDSPRILPEQIWIGGQPVFSYTAGDDPQEPHNRRLIDRVLDFSAQIKTHLNAQKPVRDLAKILAGSAHDEDGSNVLGMISGQTPLLRALDEKGGFKPTVRPHFFAATPKAGEKLVFHACDDDRLKDMLGFTCNTLEPSREHYGNRETTATAHTSGLRYYTGVRHNVDPQTGQQIFTLFVEPEDPPEDVPPPPAFELARLEFSRTDDKTAVLERASFMGRPVTDSFKDSMHTIGFFQEANRAYLGQWNYPPYRDLAAKHRLLDMIQRFRTPPSLEKDGGEFLFVPMNGSSMEKKIDNYGDGIGGGNMFISRGTKKDGTISEVAAVIGFPYAIGGPNSEYDGMNPDFLPYWDAIQAIVLDHDHFDHATIGYYAEKGYLKGKKVICDDRVKYMCERQMKNLKVPATQWPKFHVVNDKENIPLRDADGNTRMWIQFCANATLHSAITAGQILTGCYNDDVYHASYFIYNDGLDLTSRGWDFAKEGPRGLAQENGVTPEKVDRDIDVVFHDPTGDTSGGYAPTSVEFKETIKECLKLFPDKAALFVPFSTNHLEHKAITEVANEPDVMRHFTHVGANAEARGTCMNKFGVDPDQDITAIRWTLFDLPAGIQERAEELFELCKEKAIENLYAQDPASARAEVNIDEQIQDIEMLDLGDLDHAIPRAVKAVLHQLPKCTQAHDESGYQNVDYYVVNSLLRNQAVRFSNNGFNAHSLYQAIENEQQKAVRRATRSSNVAKGFLEQPDKLLVITTGPTGTADERFGTLSRTKDDWSLLDVDPEVRNTGYPIPDQDRVYFVTQPAPPVEDAEDAQDMLMRELVRKKDATIVCAYRNGFKVYNPKEKHAQIIERFTNLGWAPEYDPKTNQIHVKDRPMHIHGHGFYNNLLDMVKKMPGTLHEIVHIPGWNAFKRFGQLMQRAGKKTSIRDPDDHLARVFTKDPKTGEASLPVTDYLTPSFMLIRLRRQYGRMFGGFVEMVRAIVMRRDGRTREDGLQVRASDEDRVDKRTVSFDFNKLPTPVSGEARTNRIRTSDAQVHKIGHARPAGRHAFRVPSRRAA